MSKFTLLSVVILRKQIVCLALSFVIGASACLAGQWPGVRSEWNGFDRYDFEHKGRACIVVVPKKAAQHRSWIWRARFFGHEPQADIALLDRGFHLVYMDVANLFGSPKAVTHWNSFYEYLTTSHGLNAKPALEGMSRGGLIIYNWASANPEKVACIYADNPVCDFKSWPAGKGKGKFDKPSWQACLNAYGLTEEEALEYRQNPIDNLEPLAREMVPLLHVCGTTDSVVPVAENTDIIEKRYKQLGGRIIVIRKEGLDHHPHSLRDPTPIVDFVTTHTGATSPARQIDSATTNSWWLRPHRLLQTNLREIDATMDTDRYVREVKEFGANILLFNVGGIVANYPTELEYHWRNTFMKGDLVGETLEKLHKADIKMIGRFDFSKINEKYAADHPEWLYVSEKGEHVNYNGQVHTCVMGGYQQDYLLKILREALTKYPLDGVFFNMIGFPQVDYSGNFHGICQCQRCKQSFKDFCGLDLPKHDGDPQAVQKHQEWKDIQINRQFRRVRDLVKSIRSDTVVCTYTVDYADVIRKESGAPLGQESWDDLERAQWTLLTTEDKQLANASVHFYQMIFRHSAAAPFLHSRRLWQQMVNGAWLDFYCIGPLQRLEDRACIGPVSRIYRFHEANEKWMLNTESAAEVGLVRHDGNDYWGWVQMLSENHIQFDLVSFKHSDLKRYKAIIVPECGVVNAGDSRLLDAYVKGGGKVLLSGRIPDGLTCMGGVVLKKTWPLRHSMYVRIRPEDKEKLDVDGLKDFDLVQLRGDFHEYDPAAGTDLVLRLIHDVMYGPPEKCYYKSVSDIPALLLRKHGDGIAASLPFQIGAMYREWGNPGHPMLAVGTLDNLLQTGRRLNIESSPLVEATHRRDPDRRFEWIALYNHSGRLENSFHPPIPIDNIRLSLKTFRPVKRVTSLTNAAELTRISKSSDKMEIVLPELGTFEIVLVEYER